MSEEEKKALKYLRKNVIARIDIDENGKEKIIGYGNAHKYIILKLIKKQQKEIEEWQKAYIRENNYWLKFRNKINKIANNDKDCSDNEVIKAVKELKEKIASLQKEIKLMKSININDNYISKEKINNLLNEYANTDLEDFGRIIEFYQKLKELLEE